MPETDFNGVKLENIIFNGVDLEKVYFNDVLVFEKTVASTEYDIYYS